MEFLRQSTAVTVKFGPFLASDGITPKTALSAPAAAGSAGSSGVAIEKNGAMAGYTLSGWAHDRLGKYTANLGTGDVDTLGRLEFTFVDAANYCPYRVEFMVLSAAVYDFLFGAFAPVTTNILSLSGGAVTVGTINAGAINAAAIASAAITAAKFATDAIDANAIKTDAITEIQAGLATASQIPANFTSGLFASAGVFSIGALANAPTGGSAPTVAQIRAEMDSNSTKLASIDAKTTNLPSDPADASDIASAFSAVTSSFTTVNNTLAVIASYVDNEVGFIKQTTDALAPLIVSGAFTAAALANAPTGGSGVTVDSGTVSLSPTPTTTTFTATGSGLHAPSGGYTIFPMSVYWQTGANRGTKAPISAHVVSGSDHAFTVASMTSAPGAGDTFIIV